MTDRDDAHQLSGAYALHAVDDEEAALVEAAMAESEDFRSEVIGLTDTAVALGAAVLPVTPPPALRGALLDAIRTLPQEGPEDERPMPAGDHVVVRRRRRRRRPMALLAVAAAVVLIAGGGFFVQRTLLEPQAQFTALLQTPDMEQAASTMTHGGTLAVYWSKSEHRTAVVINGVDVPAGKVLQLWSVKGRNSITSAGVYEPAAGQHFMLLTGAPSSGEDLAVSVEPDGGSAQPTTTPIVSVPLKV